ncbi:hypothetical protein HID58_077823 [Brassica napus]|uniref:Uncharacterized protein n=1 Tax=Brassica napus TaxID=3708 RepID=A0ABQ7YRH7_BRANA|nr:hypothetical protein HID58_077823 [Brassica napus]
MEKTALIFVGILLLSTCETPIVLQSHVHPQNPFVLIVLVNALLTSIGHYLIIPTVAWLLALTIARQKEK